MATIHGTGLPAKKKIATYGKAVRRRIPEYSFPTLQSKPELEAIQPERQLPDSPSLPPTKPTELKGVLETSTPRLSSPSKPLAGNIFDVPESDDDTLPRSPRLAKPSQKASSIRPLKKVSPKEASEVRIEVKEGRKRLKLSPSPKSPLKTSAPKTHTSRPAPAALPTSKNQITSDKGQIRTIVARPKSKVEIARQSRLRTPTKISTLDDALHFRTPSPPISDVDMIDVDSKANFISPRGLKMWNGLLDSTDAQEHLQDEGGETNHHETLLKKVSPIRGRPGTKSSSVAKPIQKKRPILPRRRLIDSLVAQGAQNETSDEDSSEDSISESITDVIVSLNPSATDTDVPISQSAVPELNPTVAASASQSSQNSGLKVTYSRQRSMLAEEDLMQQLALDMPLQSGPVSQGKRHRRGSIPILEPLASFHEEEEEEEGKGAAVRSVHELRQAGANNRFLDEVEDLLDRIGSPSVSQLSMRRSGLLDMAKQMKDKNFIRQFRANAVDQKLFVHLGQENDVISGYLMTSLLTVVLDEANVPHMIPQLRRQGIARLLIRLLDCEATILSIAKERKTNMAKMSQKLVSDHHDYLRSLPLWDDLIPQVLSPRTVALKCLELMVRQTREAGNNSDIFSKELVSKLFAISNYAVSDESSWDLPKEQHAVDFYLSLSALESHSITARIMHDENIWFAEFLPTVAAALEAALTKPVDDFGVLQALVLRLTLNVTNNNPKASDVFAKRSLMSIMGKVIVAKFKQISRFMTEEDFPIAMDHLILVIGVMINFGDWSPAARKSLQSLQGSMNDPLEGMVDIFLDNQERLSEAETQEETQRNVAFGYLSVLLGYFSLLPEISRRIQSRQRKKSSRTLAASIEEFIVYHKAADEIIAADEDGHKPQSGLTARLESLVNRLGAMSGAVSDDT